MSKSPSKGTFHLAYTGFCLDRSTSSLWRVTFDNPPINPVRMRRRQLRLQFGSSELD